MGNVMVRVVYVMTFGVGMTAVSTYVPSAKGFCWITFP